MSALQLERRDDVFVLHFARGERANTLDDAVLDDFNAILDDIESAAGNAALLIISDDAKFWCNGIDLDYIATRGMDFLVKRFVPRLDQLLLRIALLNLPTLACIGGHAYGGGALIASACDFRTMRADRGYFCFPEVDIKLAFTPVMQQVVALLPAERLRRELALTGRAIGGTEAAASGVVDAAFSVEELFDRSLAMATGLAGKDRATYSAIKRGLRPALPPLLDTARR
jgi:enoyl-CoA hydratase/carnithine racemase